MSALLNRDFLVRNLCFMYRMMVASAPLLEFAIQRSEGELREFYEKHLKEETGHEEMVRIDLESFGVKDIPHDYTAAQIVGSQYYLIAHFHPALLIGYMWVLESGALDMQKISDLEKQHECNLSAFRHHAIHDPGHADELKSMHDKLPVDLRRAVQWNASGVRDLLQSEFKRWLHAQ